MVDQEGSGSRIDPWRGEHEDGWLARQRFDAQPTLVYPFEAPPARGQAIEVAPGVHWIRMPLPYALDHINLWAIDDGDGWAMVDTGVRNEETRSSGASCSPTRPTSGR